MLIFGMLSAAGVALLSFSVRSQEMADERLGSLAEVRRAGSLMSADFAQATPRLVRDEAGVQWPAFRSGTGEETAVVFVRRGWENIDGAPRPSLQKVEYRLAGDRLERRHYPQVDGAAPAAASVIAEGVTQMSLRYRDAQGEWRERWDPANPAELPRAVEVVLVTEDDGPIRQLFLAGAAG